MKFPFTSTVTDLEDPTPVTAGDEPAPATTKSRERITKTIQGLVVFIVLIVMLYVVRRRVTGEPESEPNK